jgi:DNA-binding response OmpR family regulator
MQLLLVEDDPVIGEGLRTAFGQEGYDVDWARDGFAAEHALAGRSYEVVVLDIQLPRRSGLEVLGRLRARGNRVPVLMLTSRDGGPERVAGLDAGADDYVVKPFDLEELLARLRALTRRAAGQTSTVLRCGGLVLDLGARAARFQDRPVSLSRHEFSILQALMENAGRVLSRDRLRAILYGWGEDIESNTVEVYVHHLRRKLSPEVIRTVRGVGYLLDRR